jgi:hypothetical protein
MRRLTCCGSNSARRNHDAISALVFVGLLLLFGASLGALYVVSDKWDKSVVLKVCRDGTMIVRQDNGSVWALRRWGRAYRVESDWREIC